MFFIIITFCVFFSLSISSSCFLIWNSNASHWLEKVNLSFLDLNLTQIKTFLYITWACQGCLCTSSWLFLPPSTSGWFCGFRSPGTLQHPVLPLFRSIPMLWHTICHPWIWKHQPRKYFTHNTLTGKARMHILSQKKTPEPLTLAALLQQLFPAFHLVARCHHLRFTNLTQFRVQSTLFRPFHTASSELQSETSYALFHISAYSTFSSGQPPSNVYIYVI